ncbi:MAG TPA: HAMP domain-containing sensor histidine kinase [Pseudonocardiaceae bacterium]|nr:HAMP domain-containing sensor histidine kinase [Pseudonocardiaceae bacterium]
MAPAKTTNRNSGGPLRARPLRARVRASIVTVTTLAVLLFAVPLGAVSNSVYEGAAVTALQVDATRVAAAIPDTIESDDSPVHLPTDLPANLTVGIYTAQGRLIRAHGPNVSGLAAAAADGRMHVAREGDALAVSAPVPSDQTVAPIVRVAVPYNTVTALTARAFAVLALLGAAAIGVAALLARRQARRIAVPLERLTESARALGAGDFTITTEKSQISEADTLAEAIDSTARRLGQLLDRERSFSTYVSHQLRTPLTALTLGLESALSRPDADLEQAARTALRRGEQLRTTIEELLLLARDTHAPGDALVVDDLVAGVRDRWHGMFADRGRQLVLTVAAELPEVRASSAAVQHVLDVLLGNALEHGAGETSVGIDELADGLQIAVSDDGGGLADPATAFAARATKPDARGGTRGIGLALARSLAEAEGGRLLLRRPAPRPVFCLLLPASVPATSGSPGG